MTDRFSKCPSVGVEGCIGHTFGELSTTHLERFAFHNEELVKNAEVFITNTLMLLPTHDITKEIVFPVTAWLGGGLEVYGISRHDHCVSRVAPLSSASQCIPVYRPKNSEPFVLS